MQVMNAPSHSNYNALYLKAQKRFSKGISFLSSFSYGKSIDNGSGIRTSTGDPLTPSNNYDLELETGPSAFDFRKRWTTSWIWELPFGQDRRYMNSGGVADFVLGGWQLGGILTLQDGFPIHVGLQHRRRAERRRRMLSGSRAWEPGLAAGRSNPRTLVQYGRIRRPQPGVRDGVPLWNGEAEFGRRARHQELRPVDQQEFPRSATITWSSALKCSISRTRPIWGQPGTQLGTPNYGVITSTRLDSRQVQLGLKYVF